MSGLRFECTQCGKCCTKRDEYAYVYLNRDEVAALARFLGLSAGEFRSRHTFRDEYGWTQLEFSGDRCAFLEAESGHCTVYVARPTQCRTFPFWRDQIEDGEWTEEVAAKCEGIGRGRLYSEEEAEVRIAEMEASEED